VVWYVVSFVGWVLLLFSLVFIIGYVICIVIDCVECFKQVCYFFLQWYMDGMLAECCSWVF